MKIGILTYHFSNNYGALFQAYGLRKWLLEQGHEAEFVNYQPEHVESGGNISLSKLFSLATVKIIFLKLINIKEALFGNKDQKDGFKLFKTDVLGIDDRFIYKSLEELNRANLDYDLLICGSDQIWNPSDQYGIDPVYFLDFKTSKTAKKISYAPSFGRSTIPDKFTSEIKILLYKLDAISIREESGQALIKRIAGLDATLVPDPTVLVSDYKAIMQEYPLVNYEDNYLFCYYLRSRENIGETAEYIANVNSLNLYSPHNPHRRWKEVGKTVYPSPGQWLSLLYNAKFVVTNSFHGTMLSILLNKPFVVVGIGGERAKYNERALNILKQCNLEHRFTQEFNQEQIDKLITEEIDWLSLNEKIDKLRFQGVDYLLKNLELEYE